MALTRITSGIVADNSLGLANIADNAIDATKIAQNSILTRHIDDAQITNAHMADDAIGIAELSATGTASSSTYLRGDNAWTAISTPITALNNATANELVTVGSTTTELDAEANLTFDGNTLTATSTSATQATFTGYANSGANAANGKIAIGSTTAYQGILQYSSDGNTTLFLDNTFNDAGAKTQFRMRTNGTDVDALTILGSGNVGIGTDSPNNLLDVNGGIVCSPNTDGKDTFELSTNAVNEGRLRIKNVDTTTVQIRAGGETYFNGGNLYTGHTASVTQEVCQSGTTVSSWTPGVQINGSGNGGLSVSQWNTGNTASANLWLTKSSNGTIGTQGGLSQNEAIGRIIFSASDGSTFSNAASIEAFADDGMGSNDTPGRLEFKTTADGATTPTERMRIDNDGKVGIGTSANSGTASGDGLFQVLGGSGGSGNFEAITIQHHNSTTTNDGPSIAFEGRYNSNDWNFGRIKTYNNGAGFGANMDFDIHPADGNQNPSLVTAMTIRGDGSSGARVGIGTTSPLSHLTFESDHWNTGTEDGPSIRWNNGITTADSVIQNFEDANVAPFLIGMNSYIASGGSYAPFNSSYASSFIYQGASGSILLGTASSGTPAARMTIAANGDVSFDSFSYSVASDLMTINNGLFLSSGYIRSGSADFSLGTAAQGSMLTLSNSNGNLVFNKTGDGTATGTITHHTNNYFYIKGGTEATIIGGSGFTGNIKIAEGANQHEWEVNSADAMTINGSTRVLSGDFNDTSDIALKENITDITGGLSVIKTLKPRNFDWKEAGKVDGAAGFIAQEVAAVLPNEVQGTDYSAGTRDEHGVKTGNSIGKTIKLAGILAHAVKAIQELEARLAALE